MISHSHLDHADRHHSRLLSGEHARAVASAGGLIGAWPSGVTSGSLEDFAAEIVRLADLVSAGHVGIGTDLDANYKPVLRSYADYATLPAAGVARRDWYRHRQDYGRERAHPPPPRLRLARRGSIYYRPARRRTRCRRPEEEPMRHRVFPPAGPASGCFPVMARSAPSRPARPGGSSASPSRSTG